VRDSRREQRGRLACNPRPLSVRTGQRRAQTRLRGLWDGKPGFPQPLTARLTAPCGKRAVSLGLRDSGFSVPHLPSSIRFVGGFRSVTLAASDTPQPHAPSTDVCDDLRLDGRTHTRDVRAAIKTRLQYRGSPRVRVRAQLVNCQHDPSFDRRAGGTMALDGHLSKSDQVRVPTFCRRQSHRSPRPSYDRW